MDLDGFVSLEGDRMKTTIRAGRHERVEVKTGGSTARAARRHAHRQGSLGLVTGGTSSTIVGTRVLELKPGHFVWIPPGVPHLCTPLIEPYAYAVLYVDDEAEGLLPFDVDALVTGFIDLRCLDAASLSALGFAPTRDRQSSWRSDPGIMETLVASIDEGSLRLSAVPERVPEACFEVESPDIDLPADLSRYRAYRALRRLYGLSPHELVQAGRIERAKALLDEGNSVAEAAFACGFCDQSHLVKSFRLLTGTTPQEYRNRSH